MNTSTDYSAHILGACYLGDWRLYFAHNSLWVPSANPIDESSLFITKNGELQLSAISDRYQISLPEAEQLRNSQGWPPVMIEIMINFKKRQVVNWFYDLPLEDAFPENWTKQFAPEDFELPPHLDSLRFRHVPPPETSKIRELFTLIRQVFRVSHK